MVIQTIDYRLLAIKRFVHLLHVAGFFVSTNSFSQIKCKLFFDMGIALVDSALF